MDTVKELIEALSKMPPEAKVLFYDEQYEKVHWRITKVYQDEDGYVIMLNDNYI